VALAGCGGSSTPPSTTTTATHTTVTATGPAPKGSSVDTGPVQARLVGQDHRPTANKYWSYVVHVADAHHRPLSGTLETEFAFQGAVVGKDTPPTHTFKHGGFQEDLKFPARSVGFPLELQVVVHTAHGSVTLHWPVTVHK
jgi:hypothetical protein